MRILRGLYVGVVYILATPFTMVLAMVMFITGITQPQKTIKAMVEGFKLGHSKNVEFIKYGQHS